MEDSLIREVPMTATFVDSSNNIKPLIIQLWLTEMPGNDCDLCAHPTPSNETLEICAARLRTGKLERC